MVDSSQLTFLPTSKSHDTKTRPNIKNLSRSNLDIVSLRIHGQLPAPFVNVENGRISNFKWIMTLTLDRVILHTIMHYSSTSTYMPNFTEIKKTFCGWTDIRTCTYVRMAI